MLSILRHPNHLFQLLVKCNLIMFEKYRLVLIYGKFGFMTLDNFWPWQKATCTFLLSWCIHRKYEIHSGFLPWDIVYTITYCLTTGDQGRKYVNLQGVWTTLAFWDRHLFLEADSHWHCRTARILWKAKKKINK